MANDVATEQQLKVIYRETFDNGPGAWLTGKDQENGSWHRNIFGHRGEGQPLGWSPTGGRRGGYAYTEPPWYFDDNHGEFMWLYLTFFFGERALDTRPECAGLRGCDLRNAVFNLTIRGREMNLKGTQLLFHIQGEGGHGPRKPNLYVPGHPLYNWMLTAQPIERALEDGEWHDVQVTLTTDESQWSQMGLLNGGLARKIRVIQSLTLADGALESVLNGHHYTPGGFFLCGIDPNDPPTGRIEIDEISISVPVATE